MMSTYTTTTTSASARPSEQCIQVLGGGDDHRAPQGAAAAAAPSAVSNGTETEGIDGEIEFFATGGNGDNERQTTLVIRNTKNRW